MSIPVTHEPNISGEEYRRRHETRSAWLRLVALAILLTNLLAAEHVDSYLVRAYAIFAYGLATACGLCLALARRSPPWVSTLFVAIDAALVVALFHEHLFAPNQALDHSLTALTLAVGFLLLTHVALHFRPSLVVLFSGLVIGGWLALLAVTVVLNRRSGSQLDTELWLVLMTEGVLAASFSFAAFVCYLLTKDHHILLNGAVLNERRRQNLARFFPPNIVTVLQTKDVSLGLSRRKVAILFIDLRTFTAFSETRSPEDVAEMLAEYRYIVTRAVFDYGGTIDKFIGDGVMAVFGQPQSAPDDAVRALECSLHLKDSLARWKEERRQAGKPALKAGIGLHVGPVMAGVLRSGSHDEFTVVGDTVNVAERLERLCGKLQAALVVSEAVILEAPASAEGVSWSWNDAAELDGRSGRLRIAYILRTGEHTGAEPLPDRGGS